MTGLVREEGRKKSWNRIEVGTKVRETVIHSFSQARVEQACGTRAKPLISGGSSSECKLSELWRMRVEQAR